LTVNRTGRQRRPVPFCRLQPFSRRKRAEARFRAPESLCCPFSIFERWRPPSVVVLENARPQHIAVVEQWFFCFLFRRFFGVEYKPVFRPKEVDAGGLRQNR